jgi:glyoxylase-like metal-dependent hydrolase (beta-lactamase superfamily II)
MGPIAAPPQSGSQRRYRLAIASIAPERAWKLNLGNWQLETVSGGRFRLDGGTMFGIVPKVLWERLAAADERNRIELATHCVLARDGTRTVLVDTGYGGKLSEKEREIYAAEPGEPLLASLAARGVAPEDVDVVVLSHLHFDHAGGGTRRLPDGRLVPTFPRATYVVQRTEWLDATSGAAELQGAYPPENLLPLHEHGRLRLIEGDVEIVAGLHSVTTPGHTAGHMALRWSSSGQAALYLGDLCPTSAHMRRMWGMAYDVLPLETRRRKPALLGEAAEQGHIVLWDHDPHMAACRVQRDAQREFVVAQRWTAL